MSRDVAAYARLVLDPLGPDCSLADTERYAEWLQEGGPRDLLQEVEHLQNVVQRVRDLAARLDSATSLGDGSPNVVAQAFAREIYIALAVHRGEK